MIHDWRSMFVDTDTRNGKDVILKFIDWDGKEDVYYLNDVNINWLRKALKRGRKLVKISDN